MSKPLKRNRLMNDSCTVEWGWADHYGLVQVQLVLEHGDDGKWNIFGIVSFLDPPHTDYRMEKGPDVKPFEIQLCDKIVLGGKKLLEFGKDRGKILGVCLVEKAPGLVSVDRFDEYMRVGFTFKAHGFRPALKDPRWAKGGVFYKDPRGTLGPNKTKAKLALKGSHIWYERRPSLKRGVFEKLLRRWFMRHKGWYTIHELRSKISELNDVVHSTFNMHLLKLLREGLLERKLRPHSLTRVAGGYQYRRKPS